MSSFPSSNFETKVGQKDGGDEPAPSPKIMMQMYSYEKSAWQPKTYG